MTDQLSIPADQVKVKRRVGHIGEDGCFLVGTKGGFNVVARVSKSSGKTTVLGCGSHAAIALHVAQKKEPNLVLTDLSKSDFVPTQAYIDRIPKWERITKALQQALHKADKDTPTSGQHERGPLQPKEYKPVTLPPEETDKAGHRWVSSGQGPSMAGVHTCTNCGVQKLPGQRRYRRIGEDGKPTQWTAVFPKCEKQAAAPPAKPSSGTSFQHKGTTTEVQSQIVDEDNPNLTPEQVQALPLAARAAWLSRHGK